MRDKMPANILVIDDELVVRNLLTELLRKEGYNVQSASDAIRGQNLISAKCFDAIIADILLPGMDGIALLEILKEKGIETPVILVTGEPNLETAIPAIKLGAYDYIPKPIETKQLLHTVQKAVELSNLQRERKRLEQENKRYQAELEKQNKHLETLVQERTRQLEEHIEKLHKTQDMLIQSEKLASLGQLTAGITHEINNPMAFVKSNMERVKEYSGTVTLFLQEIFQCFKDLQAIPEAYPIVEKLYRKLEELDILYILADCKEIMNETEQGINRVIEIVNDLRQFTYPNNDELRECDLKEILESAITLTWNAIKYKAELIREYNPVPKIECYPRLLTQVLVNLLINAVQAIENHGKLWVKLLREGDEVLIQVEDTGVGIPPENLSKIFDPFFTTKEVNQGTGLGLSISYGIVQKHSGKLEVKSELGKGSCFTVRLPLKMRLKKVA